MAKLFGSSGVRGLVNLDLTPVLACKVASAVANYAKAKKAVVAKDTRVSGDMLESALIAGLISCGTEVLLAGKVPTPVCAYATKMLNADVGFMLTASHNPPQYNGIKVFNNNSLSYTDPDQDAVEKLVEKNQPVMTDWRMLGYTRMIDATWTYLDMVQKTVSLKKSWHVVVDPGCGAAFNIAPVMLKSLGCRVTAINAQPDGHFPARKSEPNVETLQDLSKTVKNLQADLGIAFDGDADRVAFIDENGCFINFDRSLAAYGAFVLGSHKRGKIVTNVEASMCVETMANRYNGKVVRTRVGDIYISEAIERENAVFGGEPCGAWVHPTQHLCPDGPLSAALFLSALEQMNKSASEFVGEVPEYITMRENYSCKNEIKYDVVEGLGIQLKNVFSDFVDFSKVDGIRLSLKNGWLLVRASGTEPLIRLTVEGESEVVAKDIIQKTSTIINNQIEAEAQ